MKKYLLFMLLALLSANSYAIDLPALDEWHVKKLTDKMTDKKDCSLSLFHYYKGEFDSSTISFADIAQNITN